MTTVRLLPTESRTAVALMVAAVLGLAGAASSAEGASVDATSTSLTPGAVATNAVGDVYVVDRKGNVVDEITPADELKLVAGEPGESGKPIPGPAVSSPLSSPDGVAVDKDGNLYIADAGTNQVVEKVDSSGQLSVVAGKLGAKHGEVKPGPATESGIFGALGVAVDTEDNLYIDDLLNAVVEKVTPGGELSIAAGTPDTFGAPQAGGFRLSGMEGYFEGLSPPSEQFLYFALGIAEAGGDLYVADSGSHVVEKIEQSGNTEIVAGDGEVGQPVDGPAASSPLGEPTSLAVDQHGDIYIGDYADSMIEKVNPEGELSVVAGTGVAGPPTPGPAGSSELDHPTGVAVDSSGDLYIADEGNGVVEKVDSEGNLSIFAGAGTGSTQPPAKRTVCKDEQLTGTYMNVSVLKGHGCVLQGAHLEGSLAAHGASRVTVIKSTIDRSVALHGATGPVSISSSNIGDGLTISGTVGAVSLVGSKVGKSAKVRGGEGPVTIENNQVTGELEATTITGPPESTMVLGNTVGGKVSCSGDSELAVACNDGGGAGKD
jgi:hypothetical protein